MYTLSKLLATDGWPHDCSAKTVDERILRSLVNQQVDDAIRKNSPAADLTSVLMNKDGTPAASNVWRYPNLEELMKPGQMWVDDAFIFDDQSWFMFVKAPAFPLGRWFAQADLERQLGWQINPVLNEAQLRDGPFDVVGSLPGMLSAEQVKQSIRWAAEQQYYQKLKQHAWMHGEFGDDIPIIASQDRSNDQFVSSVIGGEMVDTIDWAMVAVQLERLAAEKLVTQAARVRLMLVDAGTDTRRALSMTLATPRTMSAYSIEAIADQSMKDVLKNLRDAREVRNFLKAVEASLEFHYDDVMRLTKGKDFKRSLIGKIVGKRVGDDIARQYGSVGHYTLGNEVSVQTLSEGMVAIRRDGLTRFRVADLYLNGTERIAIEVTLEDIRDINKFATWIRMSEHKNGQLSDYGLAGVKIFIITPW